MCVIVHHPKGKKVSKTDFDNMWQKNSHGFGMMYLSPGGKKIEVFKSMDQAEAWEFYNTHEFVKYAMHFRIATHGNIDLDNVHPYKVKEGMFLMHNGIITIPCPRKNMSDSYHFGLLLSQFTVQEMYEERDNIESALGANSKVLIMTPHHDIFFNKRLGTSEKDGFWYSNMTWKPYSYQNAGYHNTNYHNQNWRGVDDYDFPSRPITPIPSRVSAPASVPQHDTQTSFKISEQKEPANLILNAIEDEITEQIAKIKEMTVEGFLKAITNVYISTNTEKLLSMETEAQIHNDAWLDFLEEIEGDRLDYHEWAKYMTENFGNAKISLMGLRTPNKAFVDHVATDLVDYLNSVFDKDEQDELLDCPFCFEHTLEELSLQEIAEQGLPRDAMYYCKTCGEYFDDQFTNIELANDVPNTAAVAAEETPE